MSLHLFKEYFSKFSSPKSSGPTSGRSESHKADQQKYNDEMSNAYISGTKKLNKKKIGLLVRYKNTQLTGKIVDSLGEIDELGIELIDDEKINTAREKVNAKYKDKPVGGIGGAPASDLIANGLVIFTFWTLKHILEDVDGIVWDKLKKVFISIFKSSSQPENKDKHITIEFRNPQILFVFPVSAPARLFDKEMDKIKDLVKNIHKDNHSSGFSYKYVYKVESQKWELEERQEVSKAK